MSPLRVLLAVFAGGCAGGALRDLLATDLGTTLGVNLAGALLLGLLVVTVPHHWRPLLGTGLCGALTTFGSVMVVSVDDGEMAYLAATLVGGVVAAALGVALGHGLSRRDELAPEAPDLEVE